jgi:hypothetical protein
MVTKDFLGLPNTSDACKAYIGGTVSSSAYNAEAWNEQSFISVLYTPTCLRDVVLM